MCPSLKSSNRSSTRLETWRQKIIKYEWNFSVKISFIIFICFQTITIHSLPFRTSINIYLHSQYLWGKKTFFFQEDEIENNKTHQMNDEHVNLQGLYNMEHHWCLRKHEVMYNSGIKNFKNFFVSNFKFFVSIEWEEFFTFANFQCFF